MFPLIEVKLGVRKGGTEYLGMQNPSNFEGFRSEVALHRQIV